MMFFVKKYIDKELMTSLPQDIIQILLPFSILFKHAKSWNKALLLLMGAILCRQGRTVCGVLKVLSMNGEERFEKYHRVLNRVKWEPLKGAKILLLQLLECFPLQGPIVIAIDEHLERRFGKKISKKGYYRDAVRSSKKQVVKCTGLK